MTIFTAPVGYGVAYTPANVSAVPFGQKVNPHKDCIFIDPRTGELTTIRPGITPPEGEKKKGKGPKVENGKAVKVNYTGRLLDGRIFDTSVESVALEAHLPQVILCKIHD